MIKQWVFQRPNFLRWLMNLWPPFLFSGIKITHLSQDYRYCRIKLKNWPGTRNINGTQFGGSLFSMTDPIYAIMLLGNLGSRYYVWDQAAEIQFIKPGVGSVYCECRVDEAWLHDIAANTASGEKYLPMVKTMIYDSKKNLVSVVKRTLYIRLKPPFRPQAQAERNAEISITTSEKV